MSLHRYLDGEFVAALNSLHEQNTWWRHLVDATSVFLAIRPNGLNAYSNGMSMGRVTWDGSRVGLRVHEEYLTGPSGKAYVDLTAEGPTRTREVVSKWEGYIEHFERIRSRAGRFSSDERRGANRIAVSLPSVLDMEAAFNAPELEPEHDDVECRDGRFDLVTLNANGRLVFVEVKLFLSPELRAQAEPVVCRQLRQYSDWLARHEDDVHEAYRNVLASFESLVGSCFERRREHIRVLLDGSSKLSIDPVPRLLIIGFDASQRAGLKVIADRVAQHVGIDGFTERHVIGVGGPTNVAEHHLQ